MGVLDGEARETEWTYHSLARDQLLFMLSMRVRGVLVDEEVEWSSSCEDGSSIQQPPKRVPVRRGF